MPRLIVTSRGGVTREVESSGTCSVMEVIRENGFDELQALCGGCCSCATCHVYIDTEWISRLPPLSDDEDALLDAALDRDVGSRLSCQIPLTEELDGLSVTIAADD